MAESTVLERSLVFSYLKLRRTIGILGFSFPFILIIGSVLVGNCAEILSSISAYYHTSMRDIFVGMLCVVAFFLYAYNGNKKVDNIAGNFACVCALGVAFFPTRVEDPTIGCSIIPLQVNKLVTILHFLFAILFFLTLSFFSLFLFTRSKGQKTPQKIKRNKIYKTCGGIMLGSIILLLIYFFLLRDSIVRFYKPVFFLETIALCAFGVSWIVKGELILKDK